MDERRSSPAALRNRGPILEILRTTLPPEGLVLEIASGSGEHVVHFADALPGLTWQPSDPTPEALASIAAWAKAEGLANIARRLPSMQLQTTGRCTRPTRSCASTWSTSAHGRQRWVCCAGLRGCCRPAGHCCSTGLMCRRVWKQQPRIWHSMRTSGPATPIGASVRWTPCQPKLRRRASRWMPYTQCRRTTSC